MRPFYPVLFLLLAWLPAAVQAQTITSFSPASGNVGTVLTLSGTNLNLVSAVAVNGTAAVLLDQTNTVLHLLVMPGATSGPITTTGGTPAASVSSFSVTATALGTTQQGPKLIGTGAVGATVNQGISVALSADGNTLAVGGWFDNNQAGAAWVFTRSGTGWTQQGPKLAGTGTVGPVIWQGFSVALSADGNTLAVGGESDNFRAGATWVFTRSNAIWTQQGRKLVGTGAVGTQSLQGNAVSLSADGNTLAVGGFRDNYDAGATWVFTRNGTIWSQQGPKLVGTGAVGGQAFQGYVVALSADGTTLAVGGDGDNTYTGATWVFTRNGTGWTQQGPKLVGTGAVGAQPYQGQSVALSADGNTLAVGGALDNSRAGATWVFTRSSTVWSQQGAKLVGTGAVGLGSQQGQFVALSADGNTLAVGGDNDNNYIGATWLFTRRNATWSQQGTKLVGTGAVGAPNQGRAVALSANGTTLAVGGLYDNSSTGAAWVFSTASGPLAQRTAAGPLATVGFFPNPVTEQLTLTGGARAGTFRLFDSMGRTRLTGAYHDGQALDLSALPAGLYRLQFDQAPARPLLKL
jgi:hypothetical protein